MSKKTRHEKDPAPVADDVEPVEAVESTSQPEPTQTPAPAVVLRVAKGVALTSPRGILAAGHIVDDGTYPPDVLFQLIQSGKIVRA